MSDAEELSQKVSELLPAVRSFVQDPISQPTRQAQNFSILYSSISIALFFGVIKLDSSIGAGGLSFSASTSAAMVLLSLAGLFFAVRFFVFVDRDLFLFGLERGGSGVSALNKLNKPIDDVIADYEAQNNDLMKEAIRTRRPHDDFEGERRELIATRDAKLKLLSPFQNIVHKSVRRIERINFTRRYVDIAFPALLTTASVGLAAVVVIKSLLRLYSTGVSGLAP